MGLLTNNDATLYRDWFKEMAKLRGITVQYRYVIAQDTTIHGEVNPTNLTDPITLDIIFETNPRMKTLRNIGWVSETNEEKPYLMMFPFDTPHISNEARVYIPPDVQAVKDIKEFKITSINMNMEYPDCYICTVVPVMQSEEIKDDYSKTNFNYFDFKKR